MPETKKTFGHILKNPDDYKNTDFLVPTCKNKDCADPLPCNQAVPEEDHRGQDCEELPDHMDRLVIF